MATRQRAFANKMIDILNGGALNLAVAIGYRTGLFDTLAVFDSPQPAAVIAERAGLSRRYVAEWLAAMATGGILEISRQETGESLYRLLPDQAACLTRSAGSDNLAVYAQEMPLLTVLAMERVIEGFKSGRGIPYSHYPQFQAFMSELANAKHEKLLVEAFLPSIEDGALVSRLRQGIRVCDVGCGEGVALLLMAEAFPASRFVGIDNSAEALKAARSALQARGLANLEFMDLDAARIDDTPHLHGRFDYVTAFDAIHDQRKPLRVLRGIRRLLAGGGIFSMVDIDAHSEPVDNLQHPMGPFLYTVSLMHCMPVGLQDDGMGLGMMWGREKAQAMLTEAGFERIRILHMDFDPFNIHFLCYG